MPSQSLLGLWWSRQSGRRPQPACSGRGAIHSPPNETRNLPWAQIGLGNEYSLWRNKMCILDNLLITERKKTASHSPKCVSHPWLQAIWELLRLLSCIVFMPKRFYFPISPTAWVDKLHNNSAKQYFQLASKLPKMGFFWLSKNFLLSFPRDKIKNPFVRIGRLSTNRKPQIYAEKPKTFKKQMSKTRIENVNFIQDDSLSLKITVHACLNFPWNKYAFCVF